MPKLTAISIPDKPEKSLKKLRAVIKEKAEEIIGYSTTSQNKETMNKKNQC